MGKATNRSRGFTLIASLLLLVLLSGVAVGLMFLVNGSGRVGSNDLESNTAYYGAESGMEKLTADLASLYQQKMAPTQADLTTLAGSSAPGSAMVSGMTYLEKVTFTSVDGAGNPITSTATISSGPNQGLTAEIIPITLQVTAIRPTGASVNMSRGVEVALIPVFQFGVFSDSDLSYFAGPRFGFEGRVHTNSNLFLAADSGPLILDSKTTVVGEIIRDRLANGYPGPANGNYTGSVFVPNATGGCDTFLAGGAQGGSCLDFGPDANNNTDDSSWNGGIPPAGGPKENPNWITASTSTFNGFIGNATSIGVVPLQLPFVQGAQGGGAAAQQIQIIRKPLSPGESASSPLGVSREFNKANIRILLASTEADLVADRPGLVGDAQNINLGLSPTFSVGGTNYPFAVAKTAVDANWISPRGSGLATWPLVDGWLRVEYKDNTGKWNGVTTEWLKYGFARQFQPIPIQFPSTLHPNAILIFQQLADRNANGTSGGTDGGTAGSPATTNTSYYPINFYDPREGFPRDALVAGFASPQCYMNGIMNAVELDVNNLQQWLWAQGAYGAGSGKSVDPSTQNGYLLYFSDRRGMIADPNNVPVQTNGEAGLEDVINSASATGTPDKLLEAATPGYNGNIGFSPEDVDENGVLDHWGDANIGDGFGVNTTNNAYQTVNNCSTTGVANKVTGARHALRLVDGGLTNLPTLANLTGGFTVASENPVYVWGNYNSDKTDGFWTNPSAKPPVADPAGHSAAAIIADAVTLLSNNWSDLNDMQNSANLGGRNASSTYYRMAIAAGKNMNFPQPNGTGNDFGTDGGVHNFLRYIENWGNGSTLYYRGSLVSLYYSQYATGIFKCCTLVYSPPNRQYFFDSDFLTPADLPPGTPMLQDINNLSYWQNFAPCTTQSGGNCTN